MEPLDAQAELALRRELTGKVVLLLEDEAVFSTPIVEHLKHYGVARVDLFVEGEAARDAALSRTYDVLLLDRVNPGLDGLDVLRAVRQAPGPSRDAPAMIVTRSGEEIERLKGMLVGADDYVVKPVNELELVARVAARVRRAPPRATDSQLVNGALVIDPAAKTASLAGETLKLTGKEFALLVALARSVGLPVTNSMILRQCWPHLSLETIGWQNMVYQRVTGLRRALKPYEDRLLPVALRPININVKGEGYAMRDLSGAGSQNS